MNLINSSLNQCFTNTPITIISDTREEKKQILCQSYGCDSLGKKTDNTKQEYL